MAGVSPARNLKPQQSVRKLRSKELLSHTKRIDHHWSTWRVLDLANLYQHMALVLSSSATSLVQCSHVHLPRLLCALRTFLGTIGPKAESHFAKSPKWISISGPIGSQANRHYSIYFLTPTRSTKSVVCQSQSRLTSCVQPHAGPSTRCWLQRRLDLHYDYS